MLDFAVHVAISKYADHLPLERQVRRMARQGLVVTSQTLWDQLDALGHLLEPTWRALGERILTAPVLHADETGWRMMGATKDRWTVWGLCTHDLTWYQLAGSKSTVKPKRSD